MHHKSLVVEKSIPSMDWIRNSTLHAYVRTHTQAISRPNKTHLIPYKIILNDTFTNPESQKFVAICAASTSRSRSWRHMVDSDPFRVLLPSVSATTTRHDNFQVFLGTDNDDLFWTGEVISQLKNESLRRWNIKVTVFKYASHPNHIPFNALMRDVYDLGAEYMVRVNDDTTFVTSGWIQTAMQVLYSYKPRNVGVVGPWCRPYNLSLHKGNNRILTHDMVHRTHLQIFETYYPREYPNWFVDDWISMVYGAARTTHILTWTVLHSLHTGRMVRYKVIRQTPQRMARVLERDRAILSMYTQNLTHNHTAAHTVFIDP